MCDGHSSRVTLEGTEHTFNGTLPPTRLWPLALLKTSEETKIVEPLLHAGGIAGVCQTGVLEIVGGHEAYEHERAKLLKNNTVTEDATRPIFCRCTRLHGVGGRSCSREEAANRSTDEKDEICVRKKLGPTDVALGRLAPLDPYYNESIPPSPFTFGFLHPLLLSAQFPPHHAVSRLTAKRLPVSPSLPSRRPSTNPKLTTSGQLLSTFACMRFWAFPCCVDIRI
jgi:hypothetical protein